MQEAAIMPETSGTAPVALPACVECGGPVIVPTKGPGKHKKFCEASCRQKFANREKAQGAVLVTFAKVWRRARGSGPVGKAAFAEMTHILDVLNEADRKTNKVDGKSLSDRLPDYVSTVLSGVHDYRENYLDRRRLKT